METLIEAEYMIKGEKIEQVKEFVYLSSMLTCNVRYESDIERRVNARNGVNGALHAFIRGREVSRNSQCWFQHMILGDVRLSKKSTKVELQLSREDKLRNSVI